MTIAAFLGIPGLTDVGYQFFDLDAHSLAARVTIVTDGGDGWYSANVTLPANTSSVRWNSPSVNALAREYFSTVLAPEVGPALADTILKRDWQAVTGEASSSLLNAMRAIRNKWSLASDGTLTIYRENAADIAWTRKVQTDPSASPSMGAQGHGTTGTEIVRRTVVRRGCEIRACGPG